jgi:class 3 adenylate cyclase/tetratricopeptide (TPR) repeat protein
MAKESKILALMFTDLVGSSDLKAPEKLGDDSYADLVARPHVRLFRDLLATFPGAIEVDYTGDGFFASFARASDAVNLALLFQKALHDYSWPGVSHKPKVRVGIHLGEITLFEPGAGESPLIASHAADMCARLMGLAAGGQILLSRAAFDNARQYVRGHPQAAEASGPTLRWLAHGRYLFKGREEPMEVFEVGAEGLAPLRQPADSEKARRSVSAEEEATLGWRPAPGLEIPGRPGWKVDQKLGVGGFGEVWLAQHQRSQDQRVFKFCFDAERVRSFKREMTFFRLLREGLGERDDIVRLLDVRLDQPPFFVESEYVATGDLGKWIERKGGLATIPLRERLELLAKVARTVAAAHSLGIIHKDLKPSNIFIRQRKDGSCQPILADFGIGVLADVNAAAELNVQLTGFTDSLLTENDSSRTQTRLYAPPEALMHKPPTTRWDIYALGVMLYQFAVADISRPLGEGWAEEISHPILREDIAACVRRDLDKRLDSAANLAERLETLEERAAQRDSKLQVEAARLRVRRLRWQLGIVGAFLLVSLVLGSLSWVQWKQAARRRAEAERAKKSAEAHLEVALGAITVLIYDAPNMLADTPANNPARTNLLNLGQQQLERVQKSVGSGNPKTDHLIAVAQSQFASILLESGQTDRGRAALESAATSLTRLAEANPRDRQIQLDLSVALSRLGEVARAQNNLTAAKSFYERDLAIAQRLANTSTNERRQLDLTISFNKLGQVARAQGDHRAAADYFQRSFATAQKLAGKYPDKPSVQHSMAASLDLLGDLAYAENNYSKAGDFFQRAFEINERLQKADPLSMEKQRNAALAAGKLGQVFSAQGNLAAARNKFESSLATFESLAKGDPDRPQRQRDIAVVLKDIGQVACQSGDTNVAKAFLLRSLERLADADPGNADCQRDLTVAWRSLGNMARQFGDLPAARNYFERLHELCRKLAEADRSNHARQDELSTALELLGSVAQARGELAAARGFFRQSVEVMRHLADQEKGNVPTLVNFSAVLTELGGADEKAGDSASAMGHYREALDILQTLEKQGVLPKANKEWIAEIEQSLRRNSSR